MTERHSYRDEGDPAFLRHGWMRLVLHEVRLAGERVQGVLLWNVWGQVDAARELLAAPGPFTAESLRGRLPAS